jgi:hypothetical protein
MREGIQREVGHREGIFHIDLTVKARLILLAGGNAVWLAEEKKVLSSSTKSVELDDCFAYRSLSSLREGDYVVLRTSGSKDIVRDVADAGLAREGKRDLRGKALDWKGELVALVEGQEVDRFARALARRNVRLSNSDYLRLWATDIVMRPATIERFRVLIRTMKEQGALLNGEDEEAYVTSRWSMMDEIEHYHREAGFAIRRTLLSELRRRFREGAITDNLRLKLPELGNAEMSLFRVTGVDSETSVVPVRHIESVVKVN